MYKQTTKQKQSEQENKQTKNGNKTSEKQQTNRDYSLIIA